MTKHASIRTRRSSDRSSAPPQAPLSAPGAAFPKYLAQRSNGVYYFKRKVPADLVPGFGNQAQTWKSLETTDFNQACRRLAREIAAFELRIATVRMRMVNDGIPVAVATTLPELREDQIPDLVQRYYVHMLTRDDEELSAMRPIVIADVNQRKADLDEALDYYKLAFTFGDNLAVEETVEQLLAGEGVSAPIGSPMYKLLCQRLLATEVDILSEQRARLDGKKQLTPEASIPVRLQPTLTDYLAVWKSAKARPRKTLDTALFMVRRWNEVMGERPAADITRTDVKVFRDKLLASGRSTTTIKNRLGLLHAVVNAYHEEHDMEGVSNPFHRIPVQDNGQRLRRAKTRRAFEMSELNRIYKSPVFADKKLPKGQCVEAAYWVPLMGPFVGARIEELAQMRLADIEVINGVWVLRICNLDAETQALKNDNSFRRVPIHTELIKLGFLGYVCELKRSGAERLFPSLRNDNKYGIWSNALGKWWGRYVPTAGIAWGRVAGYLGWLQLSRGDGGMQIPAEQAQSLAWLVRDDLIEQYLAWKIRRAALSTPALRNFRGLCEAWCILRPAI